MTEPVLLDLSSRRQLYDLIYHQDSVKNGNPLEINKYEELFQSLDIDKLKRAYEVIFRRHDQLRSTFRRIEPEKIKQAFYEYSPKRFSIQMFDISHLAGDLQEIEWKSIKKEVKASFIDLEKQLPLAQGILVKTSSTGYTFVLYIHHLISDGFSVGLFAKELISVYEGFLSNNDVTLPPIELSCRDFLLQRQAMAKGAYGEKFYAYWEKKIKNYLTPIEPHVLYKKFSFPRNTVVPSKAQLRKARKNIHQAEFWASYTVPFENKVALLKIAGEKGVTPNVILMACFFLTAHLCYGNDKIMAVSTIPGRTAKGSQLIIGNLYCNIFIKSAIDPETKLIDIMMKIYMDFIQSCRYPIYEFDNFPETNNSIREDFQFFINFLDTYANKDIALANADNYKHRVDKEYFALSYVVREYVNGFTFTWTYQTDQYTEKVIEYLADVHLFIVNEFIVNPEATFASLSDRVNQNKFRRKTTVELVQGFWIQLLKRK